MSYLLYELTDKDKRFVNERMYQFKHKFGLDGLTAFRRALSWIALVKTMVKVGNACKASSTAITELSKAFTEFAKQNKLKEMEKINNETT